MGSFLIKCGASGQVINEGELCRVLPIIQSSTYHPAELVMRDGSIEKHYGIASSPVEPDGYWHPWGCDWLLGEYNDYGRVQLHATEANGHNLRNLFDDVRNYCPQVLQGENKYHDLPFNPAKYTNSLSTEKMVELYTELETQASDHRLFARDYMHVVRPVQFTVISDIAYRLLIQRREARPTWQGDSMRQIDWFSRVIEKAKADSTEDEIKRIFQEDNTSKSIDIPRLQKFMSSQVFRNAIERLSPVNRSTAGLYEILESIEDGNTTLQLYTQLLETINSQYVLAEMSFLNLKLLPVEYAGQDYRNTAGTDYAEFVQACSVAVAANIKERYGEDDEE